MLTLLNRDFASPFSVREAAIALGYTIEGAHRFTAYLAARGWLVRVSCGYYATVLLDAIEPTEWREDPWLVASKVFGLPAISAAIARARRVVRCLEGTERPWDGGTHAAGTAKIDPL